MGKQPGAPCNSGVRVAAEWPAVGAAALVGTICTLPSPCPRRTAHRMPPVAHRILCTTSISTTSSSPSVTRWMANRGAPAARRCTSGTARYQSWAQHATMRHAAGDTGCYTCALHSAACMRALVLCSSSDSSKWPVPPTKAAACGWRRGRPKQRTCPRDLPRFQQAVMLQQLRHIPGYVAGQAHAAGAIGRHLAARGVWGI